MKAETELALTDWNLWGKLRKETKEREEYLQMLERYLESSKLIAVTGARRSGKSTLVVSYLQEQTRQGKIKPEETLILNFEDPRLIGLEAKDILSTIEDSKAELGLKPKVVFLDEIQNMEGWANAVRTLQETTELRIIISGSNARMLSGEIASSLSGRYLKIEVMPLSFREYLKFKEIEIKNQRETRTKSTLLKKHLREYLEYGGFPEVVLKSEKREILVNYFDTIVLKDVAERMGTKNKALLAELSKYLLSNAGKPVTYHSTAKTFGISTDSARRYLEAFREAYLIFPASKFEYSIKKQIVNAKKIYAADTGLRNTIGFTFSSDSGRVLENAVFLELKRRGKEVYYYKGKRECDFLIVEKGKPREAIQAAWELNRENTERETEGLKEAMKKHGIKKGTIITYDQKDRKNGIDIVPAWEWFLEKE